MNYLLQRMKNSQKNRKSKKYEVDNCTIKVNKITVDDAGISGRFYYNEYRLTGFILQSQEQPVFVLWLKLHR